jgi:hypothetical protein
MAAVSQLRPQTKQTHEKFSSSQGNGSDPRNSLSSRRARAKREEAGLITVIAAGTDLLRYGIFRWRA